MSNSVRPHRRQPTRLPRPWDSPGKNTGVGWHFLRWNGDNAWKWKVKVKLLSRVQLLATPWMSDAHFKCFFPLKGKNFILQILVIKFLKKLYIRNKTSNHQNNTQKNHTTDFDLYPVTVSTCVCVYILITLAKNREFPSETYSRYHIYIYIHTHTCVYTYI